MLLAILSYDVTEIIGRNVGSTGTCMLEVLSVIDDPTLSLSTIVSLPSCPYWVSALRSEPIVSPSSALGLRSVLGYLDRNQRFCFGWS